MFSISKRVTGDQAIVAITAAVNEQRNAVAKNEDELEQLERAAQYLIEAVGEPTEDHLVDISMSGSRNAAKDELGLNMSVNVSRVRNFPKAEDTTKDGLKPWAPKKRKS